MSEGNGSIAREATIAGASSGTVLASLFSLMDEGTAKAILLLLAPTIAVIVMAFWGAAVSVLSDKVADWKIRNQLNRAQKIVLDLQNDKTARPETVKSAEDQVEALRLLEIQLSQKRIEAVLDTQAL
jgi:hypothetical protein